MKNSVPEFKNVRLFAKWMYQLNDDSDITEAVRCLYEMSNHIPEFYYRKTILKHSGGERCLSVPKVELKRVQKHIQRGILNYMPTSDCAKAYKKGQSITAAAEEYVGQRLLLKIDIKSFFDNITFVQVLNSVFADYYPKKVAVLLANLCCYRGKLPQGAPTSPAISNIVMKKFDDEIAQFCTENNIKYTRYCDDCLFSGDFKPQEVIAKVKKELNKMNLRLNCDKTKVICQAQRQVAVGIVVNEKMQVPPAYRKKIRQEIYYCKKFGVWAHLVKQNAPRFVKIMGAHVRIDTQKYVNYLKGKISHVLQVNPDDKEMLEYSEYLSAR